MAIAHDKIVQGVLVLADNKNREVYILLGHRRSTLVGALGVCDFQTPVKEALAMAHGDWLFLVDA